jgi:hypothetical protein
MIDRDWIVEQLRSADEQDCGIVDILHWTEGEEVRPFRPSPEVPKQEIWGWLTWEDFRNGTEPYARHRIMSWREHPAGYTISTIVSTNET